MIIQIVSCVTNYSVISLHWLVSFTAAYLALLASGKISSAPQVLDFAVDVIREDTLALGMFLECPVKASSISEHEDKPKDFLLL